jgi:C4-dicarboxylate transporter DctM subunit
VVLGAVVLFTLLVVALVIRVPISFAMTAASAVVILLYISPRQLYQIINIYFTESMSGTFIVAPMFILMAEILVAGGISKDLFNVASKWFNRLPGGLAITSIMSSAGFASVTGSSAATVATIGSISVPEMLKRNYSTRIAAGSVVSAGTLGILIPPSVAMIIYGIVTETSILQLFKAGIVPGIIVALMMSAAVLIFALIRPGDAPRGEKVSWSERFRSLYQVLPTVLLIILVLGSMYSGIATVTEAAGVGATGALLITLVMRRLTWEKLKRALIRSAHTTCMMMYILFGGLVFAFVVGYLDVPAMIRDWMLTISTNPWVIVTLICLTFIVLGCFMDPIAMLVLLMPIYFPIVTSLGFHPVWFGIIVILLCEIGMITPPVGLNLFVMKGTIRELQLGDIIRGSLPFVCLLFIMIVLLMAFPQIALFVL